MSEQHKIRVSVDIYGQTYMMMGSETSGHMRLVASMVDDKMREINTHNLSLDSSKLAVLTALNAMHEYVKIKDQIERLEEEIKLLKG